MSGERSDHKEMNAPDETIHEKRPTKPKYTELDAAGRKAYHAEKQRQRRARLKEAALAGKPRPTVPAIRDALADAAALLLREELPGSDVVRAVLAATFDAPMLASTVTGMTQSGRLPPKRLPEGWIPPVPARRLFQH